MVLEDNKTKINSLVHISLTFHSYQRGQGQTMIYPNLQSLIYLDFRIKVNELKIN